MRVRDRASRLARVCSPSRSIGYKPYGVVEQARSRLRTIGIETEIGARELATLDRFDSMPAEMRAAELTSAIVDPSVDIVLCSTGGWNAIDILPHLDWQLLGPHEKPLIGFSDNTILTTALYAILGWTTFYGPNLATFGEDPEPEFVLQHLDRALSGQAFEVSAPTDPTVRDDGSETAAETAEQQRFGAVRKGAAQGLAFGGNLGTLFLLQGTRYWPTTRDDVLLFIEEDDLAKEHTVVEALRRLESLLLQPGLDRVAGVVLGRFQPDSKVDHEQFSEGLLRIAALRDVPIVVNAPFGHVNPVFTIPIGRQASLGARGATPQISFAGSDT